MRRQYIEGERSILEKLWMECKRAHSPRAVRGRIKRTKASRRYIVRLFRRIGNKPPLRRRTAGLFERLGKHKAGKSCVYIKKLEDVDQAVLAELIADSYRAVKARYPDP